MRAHRAIRYRVGCGNNPEPEQQTAAKKIDALAILGRQLQTDGGDLVRQMVQKFAEKLMGSEVDALCAAGFGERDWDIRAGTIPLQILKMRQGSYFPEWLLEQRKRAERALCEIVFKCYVRGASTRRVDGLVKSMPLEGMSKSQVSRLAKELDETIESYRNRLRDQGP